MKKYLLLFFTSIFFFAAGAQSWNITGNAGTNPAVHFLGTWDNKPLRFRVNNRFAGEIDSVARKTFFGYGAGKSTTTGAGNTAIGYQSLNLNTTGSGNTAIGNSALFNNTAGNFNVATGTFALKTNTTGSFNVANGDFALENNTTGSYNVAAGYETLRYNTAGSNNVATGISALLLNTIGYGNVATGSQTLSANTTGFNNAATGSNALRNNRTGSNNVATGTYALYSNDWGYDNVATGTQALYSNNDGSRNTATGAAALPYNTGGHYNTANGYNALWSNRSGHYSTGTGSFTLYRTTNSQFNTAVGYSSAANFDMGWNNTVLGANSDGSFYGQYNIIAVGAGVICPDNSTARIGNTATWSIGGFAGWSNFSDSHFKKDIKENVKGIDFITKLRPVTYRLNIQELSKQLKENNGEEWDKQMKTAIAEKEKMVYTGFVAQEVEKAAEETGFVFSGVDKPRRTDGYYGLRYAEFVVPLVKAVQEQQEMISGLLDRISILENKLGNNNSSNIKTNVLSVRPNPSYEMISVNITSAKASRAFIKIFDAKGAVVKQKQADVIQGNNRFDVDIKELASGTYLVSAEWNNGVVNKTIVLMKQ
jgi:trimeric autotransporter adhesin